MYKEEENRNNSIFKKYSVNSFVLSTVNMIDNLLSNSFNHILKKMEKVEITKPQEEINHLINWTINCKRQKEFKNEKEKNNKNNNKYRIIKNNSCINLKNYNLKKKKSSISEINQPIDLLKKNEFLENDLRNGDEKEFCNLRANNKIIRKELNSYENIIKLKLSTMKDTENKSNTNSKRIYKQILKYPLKKEIFSKTFRAKKIYLDSFYEKELKFQKKLLELKGQNREEIVKNYNQQKAIDSAEQEFRIIKSSAENNNTKKNLMNLIKNSEFQKNGHMFPNQKLRDRSNKRTALVNIKNFMLMNNISYNLEKRFNPNNVSMYNEEKSKILNMECAELELLQHKFQMQRKILLKKGIIKKKKNEI